MDALSQPEVEYIIEGVKANVRTDGRERLQYREFRCEADVIDQANGSVRLWLGATEVLVGIKCELETPSAQSPDCGRFEVLVRKAGTVTQQSVEAERIVHVALTNAAPEMLRRLCVAPGRLAWVVYVDVVVVEDDGNVIDAVALAVRAALLHTQIPVVTVVSGDAETVQIELDEENLQFIRFTGDELPLTVTLAMLEGACVADTTRDEELCGGCRLTTAVTADGRVCGLQKGGQGGFLVGEMYDMVVVWTAAD